MVTDRQTRAMLAICTAILVAAALYFARSIFAPLAFALFMVAIVWPLQSTLQRKLPQFVALFITLFVTAVVLTVFASMVAWGFSVVAQWMIANAPRFQAMYVHWTEWLEQHGIPATEEVVLRIFETAKRASRVLTDEEILALCGEHSSR